MQKSNRLSTKQDHRLSQKSLILKNGKKQKHSKKSTKKPTNVPLSLLIPRLELQDQSVLECDGTLHRAEKKPCGLSRLWRCCGSREDGMSDRQSTRRWMQGAPGWWCRWGFLGIWAWFATGLVLYFGYAAPLAQPPMSQQSVCARKVLLAPFTLVRLLSTMDTLVSLKVVALNKPHITHVTSKWLLS